MQMDAKFFVGHVQYSRAATFADLEAASQLTNDELNRQLGDSFKGVLGTFVHVFRADRVWLARLKGDSSALMIPPGETFTLEQLKAEWTKIFDELESVIGGYSEADLAAEIRFLSVVLKKEFVVARWKVLLHMVNHATYHRGQITTMLLQLNHKPVTTDLIFYYLSDQIK